jgi:hypothetical protein
MRLLRGLAGALLWIVSALLGLVAVVLCVTVLLLPVGLPLLGYAHRLFTLSLKLVLPRAVSHPFQETEKSMHNGARQTKRTLLARASHLKKPRKQSHDMVRRVRERMSLPS